MQNEYRLLRNNWNICTDGIGSFPILHLFLLEILDKTFLDYAGC